jgi:hypothetical protein
MRAIACAGAALLSMGPALAQDSLETYPRRDFGAWSVYGFQGDCWMVKDGVGGASVALSTNPGDSDLYIAVENPGWTDIAGDASIEVRLSFADFDAVRPANGLAVKGRGFSLFLGGAVDSHLAALQAAPRLRFAAAGIAVEVPLADAGPAFDYMRQCTKDIRR